MLKSDLQNIIREVLREEENILVPRRMDDRDKRYKEYLNKILSQKHIDDTLDFDNDKTITSLGNLRIVNHYLKLNFCPKLKSLGKLKFVETLGILGSNITSLGNIKVKNKIFISRINKLDKKSLEKYKNQIEYID